MFLNHDAQFAPAVATPVPSPALVTGLHPTLRVETEKGWRDAAALEIGDHLYTYDGGLRPIVAIERGEAGDAAIRLPAGAFGCDDDVLLPEDQLVMVDTGAAVQWLNTPVALAAAQDLIGWKGVRRCRNTAYGRIAPVFEEEEVIFASTGLMLHCRGTSTEAAADFFPVLDRAEISTIMNAS